MRNKTKRFPDGTVVTYIDKPFEQKQEEFRKGSLEAPQVPDEQDEPEAKEIIPPFRRSQ